MLTEPAPAAPTTEPTPIITQPVPPTVPGVELPPDTRGYRLKNKLLGPPLHTEQLEHERLGKPTALAVFASDNLSSSAYATEEMLRVLIPVDRRWARSRSSCRSRSRCSSSSFFLILSYRQTIKAYPTAGGAYMVTRDNFGLLPAQVAGVALLTDYVLTVSVSVAAGTAALASAFPVFEPWILPISIAVRRRDRVRQPARRARVGEALRGPDLLLHRQHGDPARRRRVQGDARRPRPAPTTTRRRPGSCPSARRATGCSSGAALARRPARRSRRAARRSPASRRSRTACPRSSKPEWKNARDDARDHGLAARRDVPRPVDHGRQDARRAVHSAARRRSSRRSASSPTAAALVGNILFYCLQAGTMLILVLAANTSFADFPRLASFHAGDNFMPRQLTKRGPPPRVLERHHLPRGRRASCC